MVLALVRDIGEIKNEKYPEMVCQLNCALARR
jgi:hypothetical protein